MPSTLLFGCQGAQPDSGVEMGLFHLYYYHQPSAEGREKNRAYLKLLGFVGKEIIKTELLPGQLNYFTTTN